MKKCFFSSLALGMLLLALSCAACSPATLTPTPIPELNDLTTAPGHLNAALLEAEPGTYAGLWIESSPGPRVIALFTQDGKKTLQPYIAGTVLDGQVEVRQAAVSMADLLAAQKQISQLIREKSLPFSTGIDVKENRVTVEITDQALWESALRESGIKLPEYVVSQVTYEPLRGEPEFPVTPPPGLFFPQLRARSATSMTALLEGQLIEENGCLRVASSDSVNSRLIIWQPDYFPTLNGEQIEVLNRDGQVAARLGEPISLGGGEVQLSNYAGQLRQPIPTACVGPYFLMGSMVSPVLRISAVGKALAQQAEIHRSAFLQKPTSTPEPSPRVSNQAAMNPETFLKKNAWAQVSVHPPLSSNVRSEPGLKGERIGKLKPGEIVMIVEGPRYADDYIWWFVRSLDGLEGWTAQGDPARNWLNQSLDAFFYDSDEQSSASKIVLEKGQKYRVTMSGTFSYWVKQQWTDPGVCIRGKVEARPMYPSPMKTNGPVGADPFYRFARPFYGPCEYKHRLEPNETVSKIMLSLDGGINYSIATPFIANYRRDHTYIYEIVGQGFPLKVRLDDEPRDDNYGQIFVQIDKIE